MRIQHGLRFPSLAHRCSYQSSTRHLLCCSRKGFTSCDRRHVETYSWCAFPTTAWMALIKATSPPCGKRTSWRICAYFRGRKRGRIKKRGKRHWRSLEHSRWLWRWAFSRRSIKWIMLAFEWNRVLAQSRCVTRLINSYLLTLEFLLLSQILHLLFQISYWNDVLFFYF
jgi:hypothetical protein